MRSSVELGGKEGVEVEQWVAMNLERAATGLSLHLLPELLVLRRNDRNCRTRPMVRCVFLANGDGLHYLKKKKAAIK